MLNHLRDIGIALAALLLFGAAATIGWRAKEIFDPGECVASQLVAPQPPAVVAVGTKHVTRTVTAADGTKTRIVEDTPVATPIPTHTAALQNASARPRSNYQIGLAVPTNSGVRWGDLSLSGGARLGDSPFTLGIEWAPASNRVSTRLQFEF